MRPEARIAPGGQLRQRHGVFRTAAGRVDAPAAGSRRADLCVHQRGEIARVEGVSHLAAGALEADVAQRAPAQMRVDPVGEDSLVWRAELPGAGQHAAAVYPHREPECLAVFQGQDFAASLVLP